MDKKAGVPDDAELERIKQESAQVKATAGAKLLGFIRNSPAAHKVVDGKIVVDSEPPAPPPPPYVETYAMRRDAHAHERAVTNRQETEKE